MRGVGRGLGSSGKASEGTSSASRNKDQPKETGSQSCNPQKRILADNPNEPKFRSFQSCRERQHDLLLPGLQPSEAPVRLLACRAVDNMGLISSQ